MLSLKSMWILLSSMVPVDSAFPKKWTRVLNCSLKNVQILTFTVDTCLFFIAFLALLLELLLVYSHLSTNNYPSIHVFL